MGEEGFVIKVLPGARPRLVLAAAEPRGVLWSVYAFLERLGFGFYLGGDTVRRGYCAAAARRSACHLRARIRHARQPALVQLPRQPYDMGPRRLPLLLRPDGEDADEFRGLPLLRQRAFLRLSLGRQAPGRRAAGDRPQLRLGRHAGDEDRGVRLRQRRLLLRPGVRLAGDHRGQGPRGRDPPRPGTAGRGPALRPQPRPEGLRGLRGHGRSDRRRGAGAVARAAGGAAAGLSHAGLRLALAIRRPGRRVGPGGATVATGHAGRSLCGRVQVPG